MRSSTWHALGNVYLLVERSEATPALDSESVRALVGDADGIVEVTRKVQNDAHVVIWNRDGSTAEFSGNAVRIAARWLANSAGSDEVRIHVGPRTAAARMLPNGLVETEMGRVEVGEPELVAGIRLTRVSVGNPHAVVLGDPSEISRLGPLLETHPRFPRRTNVQVARVERPGSVTARVWERGVGETSSSGTSAVAVAAATHGAGEVTVHFPGGDLFVQLRDDHASLTGPVEKLSTSLRKGSDPGTNV